jgi:protein-S-isoprenylcysteine O-methyltransferase Ste14
MADTSWWRGRRGEWYVVVQFWLFALVALGPGTLWGWPRWPFPGGRASAVLGLVLLAAGGTLGAGGAAKLGSKICAVPYPPEQAVLQRTGAFCVVRHPMYCGAILAAVGWAMVSQRWLTLGYACLLLVLFDLKSRREEAWLTAKFAEYPEYQRRVRRLIPFVY